jgi:PKD repeat protein
MPARAGALLLALLVCGLSAGSARALVVRLPNGRLIGIQPRAGVAASKVPGVRSSATTPATFDNGTVDYHSGPVVHSSAPYLIFWAPSGYTIPSSTETLLTRYFTDVAHDSGLATNDYSVVRQYSDTTGIAGYAQTFNLATQMINDTYAYPAQSPTNCPNSDISGAYYPTCITDAQLQTELTRLIGVDDLPTDGATTASELDQNAPIYFIVTPANVNICITSTDCAATASGGFCSYHEHYTEGGNNNVLYAAIPLFGAETTDPDPSLSPKLCQDDGNTALQEPNGDGGDVAIKYMTHEDIESITDPLLNAWWDSTSTNEVADNCNQYSATVDPTNSPNGEDPFAFTFPPNGTTLGGTAAAGTLYNQVDNGDDYYVQSVWSNGDTNCELQPSADALTPSFTMPSGEQAVGHPVGFDGSAGSSPVSSTTWNFGDGTTSYASFATTTDPAPGTISHTYTNPGVYTVTLTVVDTHGNLATVTHTVPVGTSPNATFTVPNAYPPAGSAVSFDGAASSDSNSGGSVSSYSWSFGDGTTGSGATPTHTYESPGLYTVTLTVTDNYGLVSSVASLRLEVIGPPTAAFSFSPAAPVSGHAVGFSGGGSTDPNSGGGINLYSWSFGDGGTAVGASPSHTYKAKGVYTVKLTVTDSFGLSATVTRVLTVTATGPPTQSRASLSGIAKGKPKLTFQLAAGLNAPRLERIVIGLPGGLSFAKQGLAKGLSVKGAGGRELSFTESLSHGALTIKLRSAAGNVQVTLAGAAIAARKVLVHTVKSGKIKTLAVPVTAIDGSGTRTQLTLNPSV